MAEEQPWYLYVLVSPRTTRTYVGISSDPVRRVEQHNGERPGGARSTRAGRPWRLGVVYGPFESRAGASKAEYRLKRRRAGRRLDWAEAPQVSLTLAY